MNHSDRVNVTGKRPDHVSDPITQPPNFLLYTTFFNQNANIFTKLSLSALVKPVPYLITSRARKCTPFWWCYRGLIGLNPVFRNRLNWINRWLSRPYTLLCFLHRYTSLVGYMPIRTSTLLLLHYVGST